MPALYTDVALTRSTDFVFSTSNVSMGRVSARDGDMLFATKPLSVYRFGWQYSHQ
jgi:hypothetical protein